ncbi:MAG: biotin-dependent carboxyltransferase [Sphingobacteriales bacterium]|nr:MAG: biotin-dependent carboxyltransferase [Sphingobacteriales bacterium]
MSLRVIKVGVLDSVQDAGRYGWQHLGINPTGVMDRYAAMLANCLVGNVLNEAVLELHFPASSFFFEEAALIAITGAEFTATINGDAIQINQPILVNRFAILQFHRHQKGARVYLAIHGGMQLDKWLGSASTHLKLKSGGLSGTSLQKDQHITLFNKKDFSKKVYEQEFKQLPWIANPNWGDTAKPNEIYVLPGIEWEWLTEEAKEQQFYQSFTISNQSDRMGYLLSGEPVPVINHPEVISSAVNFGTVQLLPNGQLIILMADHQTTGGYPRVAHVISAHLSKLAQLRAGQQLYFKLVDMQTKLRSGAGR